MINRIKRMIVVQQSLRVLIKISILLNLDLLNFRNKQIMLAVPKNKYLNSFKKPLNSKEAFLTKQLNMFLFKDKPELLELTNF